MPERQKCSSKSLGSYYSSALAVFIVMSIVWEEGMKLEHGRKMELGRASTFRRAAWDRHES